MPKIKKGLEVKIKSASKIKKLNFHPEYMKYLLKIADKYVMIKRAFRDPANRGSGPLDQFEVDGYPLYRGDSGFDELIIDKIQSEEIKMSNENIVQQIIDKTNEGKDDNPKIYKLQWASGHQNILSLTEAVEVVNRWANQKGWQWIKIVNTENNKQQVVYESATRIGRKLNKLNEDMLTAE